MPDERRQYRTFPLYQGHLSVAVVRPGEAPVPGGVLDLSIRGVSILLRPDADPGLTPGDVVYLHLESPDLPEELVTPAAVRRRTPSPQGTTYGMAFLDWLGLLSRLPAELRALFNQRNDYRVGLGLHHPLEVRGFQPEFRVPGILHNLSADGLCFHVAAQGDGLFIPGSSVEIVFALPGEAAPMTLLTTILHTSGCRDRVYCGVLFEADKTPDFAAKQARIALFTAQASRAGRTTPTPECPRHE